MNEHAYHYCLSRTARPSLARPVGYIHNAWVVELHLPEWVGAKLGGTQGMRPSPADGFEKGGTDTSRLRIRGVVGTYDLRLTHDDGRLEGTLRNVDR